MTEGYFDMLSRPVDSVWRDAYRPSVTRLSYSISCRQGGISIDKVQGNALIKNSNNGYFDLGRIAKIPLTWQKTRGPR